MRVRDRLDRRELDHPWLLCIFLIDFNAVICQQNGSVLSINFKFVTADRESPAQFQGGRRTVLITEQSDHIVRNFMRKICRLGHHRVDRSEAPLQKIRHMHRDIRDKAAFVLFLHEPCRSGRPSDIRTGGCRAQAAGVQRLSNHARGHQFGQLPVKRAEPERLIDLENQALFLGKINHFIGFLHAGGHRLFNQNVFSRVQTLERLLVMIQIRRRDDNGINIGFEEFIQGAAEFRLQFMLFRQRFRLAFLDVEHRGHFGVFPE